MTATSPSQRGLFASTLLVLCGLLGGCGTNVRYLLSEQTRLAPEADRATAAAARFDTGIEKPVYDAEDKQFAACRFLTETAVEGMQRKPTFGEHFISDMSAVAVLLVPVKPVEKCAGAINAYRDSIAHLERDLIKRGVIAGAPTKTDSGT